MLILKLKAEPHQVHTTSKHDDDEQSGHFTSSKAIRSMSAHLYLAVYEKDVIEKKKVLLFCWTILKYRTSSMPV